MGTMSKLHRRTVIALTVTLIASLMLAALAYELTLATWSASVSITQAHTPTPPGVLTPPAGISPTSALTPPPVAPPVVDPRTVLGIDSGPPSLYPGIYWTRISYTTCGATLSGSSLKSAITMNHLQGVHVLLLLCQRPGPLLLDQSAINDVAHSGADAVACGNEQMKHNTYATYVPPDDFARFFDLCERSVHAVQPGIPVLLGSLDPHVGGIDYAPLVEQVGYLDKMEYAMDTIVHPGGNWHWRAQTIGLIDSWHNGYPNQSVNSLQALFVFWAQQFGVDLKSGDLGKHLWVVEGTGCVNGCGLYSGYDIAVAHILTLITDVQASLRYHVPFFYFSGKDFVQHGSFWPMGVLDVNGHPKPLRQDLYIGARTLLLSCSSEQVNTTEQEQLLARLYSGCALPGDYVNALA